MSPGVQQLQQVQQRKHRLLANHFLFRDSPATSLSRILDLSVTREMMDDEVLFLKGDEPDGLYGVLGGRVKISVESASGKEIILNIMEAGEIFGEIALLDGEPRTADARAMGPASLLLLRRRDFLPYLERDPQLCLHLMTLLCRRLRWTSGLIEDSAFLGLPGRLAKRLLGLARASGETTSAGVVIGLRLSQHELGHMLGVTREAVNKILQRWRRSGLIDIDRGRIVICDSAGLAAIVNDETLG